MLELIVGGINIAPYASAFSVNTEKAQGTESFTNFDGSEISGNLGENISLDIKLAKVPTSVSEMLSTALLSDVNVSCTSPVPAGTKFKKEKYSVSSRNKGESWDISLTLKSAAPVGGDCL